MYLKFSVKEPQHLIHVYFHCNLRTEIALKTMSSLPFKINSLLCNIIAQRWIMSGYVIKLHKNYQINFMLEMCTTDYKI
jgi:hypothetical protein